MFTDIYYIFFPPFPPFSPFWCGAFVGSASLPCVLRDCMRRSRWRLSLPLYLKQKFRAKIYTYRLIEIQLINDFFPIITPRAHGPIKKNTQRNIEKTYLLKNLKKHRENIPQKIILCGFLSRRLPNVASQSTDANLKIKNCSKGQVSIILCDEIMGKLYL